MSQASGGPIVRVLTLIRCGYQPYDAPRLFSKRLCLCLSSSLSLSLSLSVSLTLSLSLCFDASCSETSFELALNVARLN